MKVNYYLEKSGLIMVSISFGKNRLRLSTGDSVEPSYWNQDRQEAVVSSQYDGSELNYKLSKLRQWCLDEHRKQVNDNGMATVKSLREAFLKKMGREVKSVEPVTLAGYFEVVIETGNLKESTKDSYRLAKMHLENYENETGVKIMFDQVTKDFYYDFTKYLRERVRQETSIGLYVAKLKHVLNHALDAGVSSCIEQKKYYFKSFSESSDKIYLTSDEVNKIAGYVTDDPKLAYVRDLFVLACYTGLRWSDWNKYTEANIVESRTLLRVHTQKTGELVYIPIHPVAREIIDRIMGVSVCLSVGKFDVLIKKIAKEVGLTDNIMVSYTTNGLKTSQQFTKCELVSSHTARRSFATNAFKAGVPVESIRRITGHKTESAFRSYLRLDNLQNAELVKNHPFFSGNY